MAIGLFLICSNDSSGAPSSPCLKPLPPPMIPVVLPSGLLEICSQWPLLGYPMLFKWKFSSFSIRWYKILDEICIFDTSAKISAVRSFYDLPPSPKELEETLLASAAEHG